MESAAWIGVAIVNFAASGANVSELPETTVFSGLLRTERAPSPLIPETLRFNLLV